VNDVDRRTRAVIELALVICGFSQTVSARFCVAVPWTFVAVTTTALTPEVPAAAEPEIVPWPGVVGVNVSPCGSPVTVSVAAGLPDVVMLFVNASPIVAVPVARRSTSRPPDPYSHRRGARGDGARLRRRHGGTSGWTLAARVPEGTETNPLLTCSTRARWT